MNKATGNAAPASSSSALEHYFVSSALGWATATRLEDALLKIARDTGSRTIRRCLRLGGLRVWSCRVLLPHDARYTIRNFIPEFVYQDGADVGSRAPVPFDTVQEYAVLNVSGTAVPVQSGVSVLNSQR